MTKTQHPYVTTRYSQRHPHWVNTALGTSAATIGNYGCLISALASGLADLEITLYGREPDPGSLNRWLARNNGFTQGNLLVFGAVVKLGVEMAHYVDCSQRPAPLDVIADALAQRAIVLAEVDFRPGGSRNQHWVRILPTKKNLTSAEQKAALEKDCYVMDPWMPDRYSWRWLMSGYALPSWDGPERALFRVVVYQRQPVEGPLPSTPEGHYAFTGDVTTVQPELHRWVSFEA